MDQHAIIKFINYSAATPGRAKRLSFYLKQLPRTSPEYVTTNYLCKDNSEHGLNVIENRWHPKGNRLFKQGILSFGATCQELAPEKALQLTQEVMEYFSYYPWLAAVHTNKPEHIHAHFLLGMTNVHTGHKYSQSPHELRNFKDHYNAIASKNSLPQVNWKDAPAPPMKCHFSANPADYFDPAGEFEGDELEEPMYYVPPAFSPSNTDMRFVMPPINNPLEVVENKFKQFFAEFYMFGYTKG